MTTDTATDSDRPLSVKVVIAGLPQLRAEAARISGALAACSSAVRLYQIKIEEAVGAMAAGGAAFDALAAPLCSTAIEISLRPEEFERVEQTISRMQALDAALSIDDCLNEIFSLGLAMCVHLPPTT